MLSGSVMLLVGALVTFGAILSGSAPVLLLGTALVGLGFGPAFLGAYRPLSPSRRPMTGPDSSRPSTP